MLTSVALSITDGRPINLFRVQTLDTDCAGEVTAIEYCYRYSTTAIGQEEAFFNWTVLILEETDVFTITRIYGIESRPDSLSEVDCVNTADTVVNCCDREDISNFNLQQNNFIFGMTESAQGNTRKATLLGFSASLPEYIVDTVLIVKDGQTIDVGSTLPKPEVVQEGLRMLWFVTGT